MAAKFWLAVVRKVGFASPLLTKQYVDQVVNLAFSREFRLLTPGDFAFVFQQAVRVSSSQITILGRANNLGHPRVGFAIAKKQIKRAHERNRVKRLVRESFRLQKHLLPCMDFVIMAKKETVDLDNKALFVVLNKLWLRHCQKVPGF